MARKYAPTEPGTVNVYGLVDPRNRAIRYVGATSMLLCNRLSNHLTAARGHGRGETTPRSAWIRELLAAGVRPDIILLQVCFTPDEAERVEAEWIVRLRDSVLNGNDGGAGHTTSSPDLRARIGQGVKAAIDALTPEQRQRRIAPMRAAAWTPEANAKRAQAWVGRKHRPESVAKMRAASTGRKQSPEVRARMAESQKRRRAREASARE